MPPVAWLRTLARRFARHHPVRPYRRRLALEELEGRVVPSAVPDFLHVGDAGNNTVQRFDATGEHLGTFVAGDKSLKGPRGLIFDGAGHLLLANQNIAVDGAGNAYLAGLTYSRTSP